MLPILKLPSRDTSALLATPVGISPSAVRAMTIRTFFTIISVLALAHGVGFMLIPEQVASGYGMATSASSVLTARLFGGALLAWG
jgi:hypothetical protein